MSDRYEYFDNQVKVLENQLELWEQVWNEDVSVNDYTLEEKEKCLRKVIVLKELIEHTIYMRDNEQISGIPVMWDP